MRTETFTCDEKGCEERHEREPSNQREPPGWMFLELWRRAPNELEEGRLVFLCPEHASELLARFAHVELPKPGRPVRR